MPTAEYLAGWGSIHPSMGLERIEELVHPHGMTTRLSRCRRSIRRMRDHASVDLDEFLDEVDAFAERRYVGSGFDPNVDFTYLPQQGILENRSRQPDIEDFRSFLMDLRLFWAKRERFYLADIQEAARDVVRDDLPVRLEASVERLARLDDQPGAVRQVFRDPDGAERTLTNRELADWWMHGAYFHRSNTKKTRWWRGHNPLARATFEWHLRKYVRDYAAEVFEVAAIIRDARATRLAPEPGPATSPEASATWSEGRCGGGRQ